MTKSKPAEPAEETADPMPVTESRVDQVRESFVQLWGSMGHFWGIPPTTARVHSWLLSQPDPADTDEIMHGLEMSRGAVSMACRELRDWGLIQSEKLHGSRRVSYRPATDLEKVIRNIVRIRKRREWDPVLENLRDRIPQLAAEESEEADALRGRLEAIEGLTSAVDTLIERFLKGGLVGRLGLKLLVQTASDDQTPSGRRESDVKRTRRENVVEEM